MWLDVMIINLDTLAVSAKHAMSANTRVELNLPSPSLGKRKQNHHAGSTLVYHHLSAHQGPFMRFGGIEDSEVSGRLIF